MRHAIPHLAVIAGSDDSQAVDDDTDEDTEVQTAQPAATADDGPAVETTGQVMQAALAAEEAELEDLQAQVMFSHDSADPPPLPPPSPSALSPPLPGTKHAVSSLMPDPAPERLLRESREQ